LAGLLKTNAQKKWAVKTRPFGREAGIVTRPKPGCKRLRVEIAEKLLLEAVRCSMAQALDASSRRIGTNVGDPVKTKTSRCFEKPVCQTRMGRKHIFALRQCHPKLHLKAVEPKTQIYYK
jgi:hypothetical protein